MALPASTYDKATLVNPTSSLTDFTLIVDLSRLSSDWWAAVDTTDGTKGRAAKDSGPTELACDWIDFDSVNETGLLRVKWSGTLATTGIQTLRIYPPQSGNASVAANATYGSDNAYDSDWVGYWPLHDLNDRTANGYDLTAQSAMGAIGGETGKLGRATDFTPVNNARVDYTAGRVHDGPDTTRIIWYNPDVLGNYPSLLVSAGAGGQQTLSGLSNAVRANEIVVPDYGIASVFTAPVVGTWIMISGQFVTTSSRYAWYNKTKGSQNTVVVDSLNTSNSLAIGQGVGGGLATDAKLQHAQVHSVSRADDWIEYEFDQMDDQATFWGTWVNVPVAGSTSSGAGTAIPAIMYHRRMMGVS